MFLKQTLKRNPDLIYKSIELMNKGLLEPDTYVIDMDHLRTNAKMILDKAKESNISLYFMTKQIGRNPVIAQELVEMGYSGAVVVDFREAEIMMDNNIPLGNVGHLVQTPKHSIKRILEYGTEVMTVFTLEKLREINTYAKELDMAQDIILKVAGPEDLFYSGQEAGIELKDLEVFLEKSKELKNINIVGATSFPCYLYNYKEDLIERTPNLESVLKGIEIMKEFSLKIKHINLPSTTSVRTLNLMKNDAATHGEPGHGLTGTTPAHAFLELSEVPSVIYLSEVSHNFRGKSYCYGGGHYRRSRLENALVYETNGNKMIDIKAVPDDSIDYYFELSEESEVSAPVVMAFRFQMFVSRSKVVLLENIQTEENIMGVYDGLGRRLV